MVTGQVSKMIGSGVKRKRDSRLITDDVQLSCMTYMAVLRTPHTHARILTEKGVTK